MSSINDINAPFHSSAAAAQSYARNSYNNINDISTSANGVMARSTVNTNNNNTNNSVERVRPAISGSETIPRREITLHLRPAPTPAELRRMELQRQGVRLTWVDGIEEHPNQRVSKSCCVFHKKKLFGESSSDESSSSTSSTCSESDHDNHDNIDLNAHNLHGETNNDHNIDNTSSDANNNNNNNNDNETEHSECCGQHKHKHHKKPKCTKEHCYCGTRFH